MKTQLYSILNTSAKNWWYHRQLRKRGEVKEARRRERKAILDDVRVLRAALENDGFLTHGRGGWILHYEKWARHECRGTGLDAAIPQACLLLGIPILDSSTIPDERICKVLNFPMANPFPNPEPPGGYGPFDHAPFEYVARLYVELGATVYNLSVVESSTGATRVLRLPDQTKPTSDDTSV
jgi:hypothetical protein